MSDALKDLARQLLIQMGSATDDTTSVDDQLLKTAESLIVAHQFFVQLSFVDLIIERIKKIDIYFEAMDVFAEEVSTEDLADMSPAEKIRGVQALTNATRVQLETVNTMLSNKDASNVMISNLRENFGGTTKIEDSDGGAKEILEDISGMESEQRQRVLRGTIEALRELARKETA
jgi:hypothetical protein